MTLSHVQDVSFLSGPSRLGSMAAKTGFSSNFSAVFDQVSTSAAAGAADLTIAAFRAQLTGNLEQDSKLLGDRLPKVQTVEELEEVIDTFLEPGRQSAKDALSHLIDSRRISIHPMQEELDRMVAAHSELKSSLNSFGNDTLRNAASDMIEDLEAQIEALRQRISEDIQLKAQQEAEQRSMG